MDYYRRFPGDYLRDTLGLTLAEDGAYTRLLDFHYTTEKPIRSEEEAYRIARAATKNERKLVQRILHMFFHLTDAGWSNPRALKEIIYAESKRSKAKASAEARWKPDANAMRTHCDGNAIPDNQTIRQKIKSNTSPTKPVGVVSTSTDFIIFWEAYPRKVDKKEALRAWRKNLCEGRLGEILASLESWRKTEQWQETEKIPYPSTFLNKLRWQETPRRAEGNGTGLLAEAKRLEQLELRRGPRNDAGGGLWAQGNGRNGGGVPKRLGQLPGGSANQGVQQGRTDPRAIPHPQDHAGDMQRRDAKPELAIPLQRRNG